MAEPGGFGILAGAIKAGAAVVRPILAVFGRPGRLADDELRAVRERGQEILTLIDRSSVQAQAAVEASPNDPRSEEAAREATQLSTEVGQRVASLFNFYTIDDKLHDFRTLRLAYRAAVSAEENMAAVETQDRQQLCETIERSSVAFQAAVCDEVWKRFGVGIGYRAGHLKNRKLPG